MLAYIQRSKNLYSEKQKLPLFLKEKRRGGRNVTLVYGVCVPLQEWVVKYNEEAKNN